MFKNKVNFKLINVAIALFIILMIYLTRDLWLGGLDTIFRLLKPFIFAFAMAYACYPLLKWFEKNKVKKEIAAVIITFLIIALIALVAVLAGPTLFKQLSSLFNNIISFIKDISNNYAIDLGGLQTSLSTAFNNIISSLSQYISNGTVSFINTSISVITQVIIALVAMAYFLTYMDSIRHELKKYLLHHSKRTYDFLVLLDHEMRQYLIGFIKIMFISLFEYTIAYAIIGHPNYAMLGLLYMLATLIPYFGGIAVNIIAVITAFAINPTIRFFPPSLLIGSLLIILILPNVDAYVLSPYIYGKTIKINPLLMLLGVFGGGILFGIYGVIFSLPIVVTIVTAWKFYEDDIVDHFNK